MNAIAITPSPRKHRGPPEDAYSGILKLFGLIQRAMRPYFQQFGLSHSQWAILRVLYRAEEEGRTEGLRMVEIGQRLLVQPPSVTTLVRRLEKTGLACHATAPNDRRGVELRLTPQGRELVQRILLVHRNQIRHVVGGLNDQELTQFCDLLERLNTHLVSATAPGPDPSN